jgi:hypothetical protein
LRTLLPFKPALRTCLRKAEFLRPFPAVLQRLAELSRLRPILHFPDAASTPLSSTVILADGIGPFSAGLANLLAARRQWT